jgi:tripartite-type tricarboxylate transporter receptor subunit TctC
MTKTIRAKLASTAMAAIAAVAVALPGSAVAEWPEKPIKIFVGYAAGGGTDTYARIMASMMHEEIDQPMVVVNKPGASSMIALKFVSEQPADGYTVLMQAVGSAIAKEIGNDSPVAFRKDLRAIGILGVVPAILATPFDSPYKSAEDFIAYAKSNPGKARWSHNGRGSMIHLAAANAFESLGLEVQDVPFKGGAKSKAAVVAGQVDVGLMNIQHYSGFETKLRVLGVFDDARDPDEPDLPTFKELGYDVPSILSPFGVYVRAGTPDDVVAKLQQAVKAVTEKKGYKRLIAKAGLKDKYMDPATAEDLVDAMFVKLAN